MINKKLLSRKEYEQFLADLPKGVCPFCEYKEYQIILGEYDNWIWIATLAPYWPYHTMLVPKRHFESLWDATESEMKEFKELAETVTELYRKEKLYWQDRSPIKQYVYFWRHRDDLFDPVSGNTRPDHFHFHIAPDKDHAWDGIVDPEAYLWDIGKLKRE